MSTLEVANDDRWVEGDVWDNRPTIEEFNNTHAYRSVELTPEICSVDDVGDPYCGGDP